MITDGYKVILVGEGDFLSGNKENREIRNYLSKRYTIESISGCASNSGGYTYCYVTLIPPKETKNLPTSESKKETL